MASQSSSGLTGYQLENQGQNWRRTCNDDIDINGEENDKEEETHHNGGTLAMGNNMTTTVQVNAIVIATATATVNTASDASTAAAAAVTTASPSNLTTKPSRQRYTVLITASSTLFVGIGYTNTFGIFQEHYRSTILRDQEASKIIVIGSSAASLYMILGVFTGRFADLVGYRPSLLLGSALMVGSQFAAARSTTYVQLLWSQGFMFGLGLAFVYLPAVSISRGYWKAHHGVANGVVVSGGALGGTILPYVVKHLIARYGLATTFRILGLVALVGLLPGCIWLRPASDTEALWRRQRRQQQEGHSAAATTGARPSPTNSSRQPPLFDFSLLSDPKFNALLAASTVAIIGFLPRYFLIPGSAVAQGISPDYAAWLLGLMNGLSIVGRVGIGWIADRFGKINSLALSFVLCGLGHFMFWLPGVAVSHTGTGTTTTTTDITITTTATAMFTCFVVYVGIFGSGFVSLFPVVMAHLFGADALASKQGLLNTIVGCGVLAGPSAVYAIVGNGQARRWALAVVCSGLFMVVGGLLMWFLLSRPLKLVSRRYGLS